MKLLVLLGLAWSSAAMGAEPLFVPSFTPNTPNEATLARELEQEVTNRLREDGHLIIDATVAETVVTPGAITRCAVLPTCPSEILPQLPARLSIVVRVDKLSDGTILGHVEYYEATRDQAVRITDAAVPKGDEAVFANEVARTTNELIEQTGPTNDAMRDLARKLIADAQAGLVVPKPVPAASSLDPDGVDDDPPTNADAVVVPPTADDPSTTPGEPTEELVSMAGPRGDGSTPHSQPIDALIADTSVKRRYLVGAERHFKKSGLDPRDYMYVATPHSGRVVFEVRAGFGSGDINRTAQIRTEAMQDSTDLTQTNAWFQEGPATGQSFRGEFVLGYAPVTFIDFGLLLGLQYGERSIRTGTYVVDGTDAVDRNVSPRDDIQALNLYLQPRLRLFVVPFGPAKPFLVGGADFRFIDDYALASADRVTFLTPESAVIPGAVVGAGMMIDPGPIVGLFAEATYTRHLGDRAVPLAATTDGLWLYDEDPLPETDSATFALSGGVQFRL